MKRLFSYSLLLFWTILGNTNADPEPLIVREKYAQNIKNLKNEFHRCVTDGTDNLDLELRVIYGEANYPSKVTIRRKDENGPKLKIDFSELNTTVRIGHLVIIDADITKSNKKSTAALCVTNLSLKNCSIDDWSIFHGSPMILLQTYNCESATFDGLNTFTVEEISSRDLDIRKIKNRKGEMALDMLKKEQKNSDPSGKNKGR